MPTESYELAEVEPSITRRFPSVRSIPARRSNTINDFRSALEAGGWTCDEANSPVAWVRVKVYVDGMPIASPEPPGGDDDKAEGAEICEASPAIRVRIPGGLDVKVWGYDPGAYKAPPCDAFAYGATKESTYSRFITSLTAALGMAIVETTSSGGFRQIKLQAPEPGPAKNGVRIEGWANGTVWYGGWKLQSGTYRGESLTVTNWEGPGYVDTAQGAYCGWVFDIRIAAVSKEVSLGLSKRWAAGTMPATGTDGWYRIAACPYQFGLWFDGGSDTGQQTGPYPKSLFVSMPWVPDAYTGHSIFAFAVNSIIDGCRANLEWSAYTTFDGAPWSASNYHGAIIPALRGRTHNRYPNDQEHLTTTQGLLLADNAWVCASKVWAGIVHNRVAGKLWNCCVIHNSYPLSVVSTEMMNATWVHVSSHSYYWPVYVAQGLSVWWKVTPDSESGL